MADGNGEIGAQAEIAPRRIGERESPAADFLARTVQENVGGLEHRGFFAGITARAEGAQDGAFLRLQGLEFAAVVIGKSRHQPFLNMDFISATSASRLTLICAWR